MLADLAMILRFSFLLAVCALHTSHYIFFGIILCENKLLYFFMVLIFIYFIFLKFIYFN